MNLEPCDLERGEELEPVGKARRFRTSAENSEIWLFSREDERAAKRLLDLGQARVGGFLRGGIDDDGVWLVRKNTTSARGDRGVRPWREVLGIVHALAGGLAACESRGLFPGPLRWSELALDPPCIAAEALVRAIVGAPASLTRTSSEPSLKWTPPEQAAGAAWDSAANRYVLGLIAYRLLSGGHPFEGGGLRHAAQAQASSDPAPFEESVASKLKPGVQSFVLRMLAADPRERPANAKAVARACDELLADAKKPTTKVSEAPEKRPHSRSPASHRSSASSPRAPRARSKSLRAIAFAPLLAGAAAVLVAVAARSESTPKIVKVADVSPLTEGDSSVAACGSCHAREVAEWSRSAMSFSAKSPLYGALESLVEEQFARSNSCPNGAGVLRASSADACFDDRTRAQISGAGGEDWCINCHSPATNLGDKPAAWSALGSASARRPAIDLLSNAGKEGVSCIACHSTVRGVDAHVRAANRNQYEGNSVWRSFFTGQEFSFRPEELRGETGIANSGYLLDARSFFRSSVPAHPPAGDPIVHRSSTDAAREYRSTSEFCGACHDVRLFGTDAIGKDRGEHFKRLRNAYSEWKSWADTEERAGKKAASCQGCHMSLFPGTCEPGAPSGAVRTDGECPAGTHLVARAPGELAGDPKSPLFSHYFTSVDFPLTRAFDEKRIDDPAIDAAGIPVGLRARQRMLLEAAFRFSLGETAHAGNRIEIPITVENVGAGHRVPAGFSQEREIWIELEVKDARGALVYSVGKLESAKDDLGDKIFTRVNTSDAERDFAGRPLGVFGADVVDGPDVPRWSPNPALGGTRFFGKGLVNFQNGFLRCVRCIGEIDAAGECKAGPGQGRTRADRFDDGAYDADTGECRSNLSGGRELFETYFPVGSLDAERGILKAPDAIIDTRSAPPDVPITYTYDLETSSHPAPFDVHATLHFRAFPPYLIKAFADYERDRAARGERPGGAQVDTSMLDRLEILDIAEATARIP